MALGRPKARLTLAAAERERLAQWVRRRRGVHRSTRELETAIKDYLAIYNDQPKPFVSTKTADQIFASVARFCNRTSDSGH